MPIPSDYASPIRLSAKERALSQIQRWIIDGTLQPGEKLMDAELADALSVSRTPIREALQLLEVQGLVEMFPGKETKVKMIERDDILKMYPVLASLHALAAELATPLLSPAELEQLKGLNAQFSEAIRNGQPYQAMEYDELFHNTVVDAADNSYIASYSSSLQVHIRRFKYVFLKQQLTANSDSVEEHAALIQAFEARDANAATLIMKQNLLRPMKLLHALMNA